jgi:hypothetical protein
MSSVLYIQTKEEKMKLIHDFLHNMDSSMLVILGENKYLLKDYIQCIESNCSDSMTSLNILKNNNGDKYVYRTKENTVKILYSVTKMSLYIEEIIYDWNASVAYFQ